MYIEICKDVIEDAIAKSGQKINDSLDLLQLLALFSSKGNHIVSVPCLLNDLALTQDLVNVAGSSFVRKLRRSEGKFYMLQSIKPVLSTYCLVTYSDNKKVDNRAIVYNPTRMQRFEPFLRTKLITENILDAVFFNYIAHFYLRKTLFTDVRIRFEATPGGGSTTCDVVKHEILEKRRFCLVIVDSDKKYPNQPNYGDTARKIVDVIGQYPSDVCKHYVMENVMEVENLIPHRIVRKYASEKSDSEVLNRNVAFYDMKIGLTLKGLYNDYVFHYLSEEFSELDYSQRNEAKSYTRCRDDYEQYIDDHHLVNVLKKGFGSDLLKIVTCACDENGKIRYPELEDEMKNKIIQEDLTAEQQIEWENIGSLMFSWMCGLAPKNY
ncbi:MAG: hypothetical protein IJQ89_11245 [Bacteroidales bacterium]|nr:hypothetical protein [Bacteroidales bacterium]